MHTLVNACKTEDVRTENDMTAHSSSGNSCLDFFGSIASARNWNEVEIQTKFIAALEEDPLSAMRILFWARDIRGGQGERRVFRVCLDFLNKNRRGYLNQNLHLIPEYGRWDDLFGIDNSIVLELIEQGLEDGNGLLAKWLPRKGEFSNKVRKYLNLTPKEYRKLIVGLSKTVEQQMSSNKWDEINYEHVPSQAMNIYRNAFQRHDPERWDGFINAVKTGEKKINADTLYPYQLYQAFKKRDNEDAIEAQWNALPNFLESNKERLLPVCDTSGSMNSGYGSSGLTPMDISISLGVYISERNKGIFKDTFITFSHRPHMQYLKGSVCQRFETLRRADWEMNTDLEAVFRLILDKGVRYSIVSSEMPTAILIISDMQFDRCVTHGDDTALSMIDRMYEEAGYKRPKIIFWNCNARVDNTPVKFDDRGVGLVSGAHPSILETVLSGKFVTPVQLMMQTVHSERYQAITV